MKNRFFTRAIAAAKKGPKAFAAEFTQDGMDANAKEWVHWSGSDVGMSLIHKLIMEIPDSDLPNILATLANHLGNLEARDSGREETPLAAAARYQKQSAVNFLVEQKADVNASKVPPLYQAIRYHHDESISIEIIKSLLQNKADINVGSFGASPLFHAADERLPEVTQFLISRGADLFIKRSNTMDGVDTAVSIAYKNIIKPGDIIKEDSLYAKRAKKSFDVLLTATKDFLYQQGKSFIGHDENLKSCLIKFIDELSGEFFKSEEMNSAKLKELLIRDTLLPVLTQLKAEQLQSTRLESGTRLHSGKVRLWSFDSQANIQSREDDVRVNNVLHR